MVRVVIDKAQFENSLNKAMEGIAFDITESMRSKLTKEHGRDTGVLASSINYKIENNGITIEMAEHGKYVEFGTPPHFPPVEALIGWVKRKWGATADNAMRKAWLLALAISKRGTRSYPFIRNTFQLEGVDIIKKNLKLAFN